MPGEQKPHCDAPVTAKRLGPAAARLLAEPLLRDDALPLDPGCLLGAGDDGMPVHDHRARAAGALRRAPVLHRPQPEVVAEQLEQALPFARLRDDSLPVERELHRYSTAPSTSAIRAIRMTTPLNASCQYRAWRVASTSAGSSSMRGRLCRTIALCGAFSRRSCRVTR